MADERFSDRDRVLMRRALHLAVRGRGRVEPNPLVGCVLVRAGRVIGQGYHRRYGGPHAEVDALRRADADPRGAIAYVTLEPCSHHGKTPPCCDALIEAGIKRVVAAMTDPFPEVSGRGVRRLRRAGVRVDVGLLRSEAVRLNQPYLVRLARRRVYVICKWAQSLDGKIATRTGDSKWISGDVARRCVHRLRARMDAVMVGIGTVLGDDPMLTARQVRVRRVAARVVLDSALRTPPDCRLVQTAGTVPTYVLTTHGALKERAGGGRRLESRGVRVVAVRGAGGCVSLRAALSRMAAMGWTNVLVEGGGRLIGSCFDAGVVDEAHVYTAPLVIGGARAATGCAGRGVDTVARAWCPVGVERRMLGETQLTIVRFDHLP